VQSVLADGGVIAANTFSSSKLYAHESATYYAVFGDFINVSRENRSNRIILTGYKIAPTNEQISARVKALTPRLAKYDIDIKAISENMHFTKNSHDWPGDTKVLTDQYSPANLLNF
jgi:spermidine synthase